MTLSTSTQTAAEATDHGWDTFRVIGGIAALVAAIVFRRWLSAEFGMFRSFGLFHSALTVQPSTPLDWFALLHSDPLVGLLLLNVFDLVNYALVGVMYFGICSVLRRSHRGYISFAIAVTIVGTGIYFTSNQAFPLLSLSNQYSAATSDAQRLLILAARVRVPEIMATWIPEILPTPRRGQNGENASQHRRLRQGVAVTCDTRQGWSC